MFWQIVQLGHKVIKLGVIIFETRRDTTYFISMVQYEKNVLLIEKFYVRKNARGQSNS